MKKWIYWILVLAMMGVIFSFSAQKWSKSSQVSGSVTKVLVHVYEFFIPNQKQHQSSINMEQLDKIIRKAAHFTEYMILAALVLLALARCSCLKWWQICIFAIAIVFLYACTDEYHQRFVAERTPQFKDVVIDTLGGTVSALIYALTAFKRGIREKTMRVS